MFHISGTPTTFFPMNPEIDGPRINIDDSSDDISDHDQTSSNTSAVTGGIGGAVCLVALIAGMAVKRKRDGSDKTTNDEGNRLNNYLLHNLLQLAFG